MYGLFENKDSLSL